MIIHFYFQCVQMTMNDISTSSGFILITLLIVRCVHVSGSISHCKTVYLACMYKPKTKLANFVKRVEYILSTILFGRILYLSISVYRILTQMSQVSFLSTWHMCNNNEVIAIMIVITIKSENFIKRLMVLMEPRSCPWNWTKFLGIPLTYPWPTGIPRILDFW